jgi:hypothetical protein
MVSKQTPASSRARSRTEEATQTLPVNPTQDDAEARRRRTAIAAFYRAEARGFAPGREVEDWLEAEREIAALDAAQASRGEPRQSSAPEVSSQPQDAAPARKRAPSKRSRTTRTARGASIRARNRGDES